MKRSMARLGLAGLAAMVVAAAGGCAPSSENAEQKSGVPASAQSEMNRRMGGVTGPQGVTGAPSSPGMTAPMGAPGSTTAPPGSR
jgi:hypothetical protein